MYHRKRELVSQSSNNTDQPGVTQIPWRKIIDRSVEGFILKYIPNLYHHISVWNKPWWVLNWSGVMENQEGVHCVYGDLRFENNSIPYLWKELALVTDNYPWSRYRARGWLDVVSQFYPWLQRNLWLFPQNSSRSIHLFLSMSVSD